MEIGTLIAKLRAEAGIKQYELATKLEIARTYLCDIEKNRKPFPERFLPRLPPDMRRKVAAEMIRHHRATIAELQKVA